MISGVLGSASGGIPGALNNCRMPGPQKIWPIPAMLLDAGDVFSSVSTASSAVHFVSHNKETSSSVGPICPPAFDSESGKQLSTIFDGDVVTGDVLSPLYRWV